jgi:hypothetical protein
MLCGVEPLPAAAARPNATDSTAAATAEAIDDGLLLTLEVAPQVCHVSLDMRVPPIETGQQHG